LHEEQKSSWWFEAQTDYDPVAMRKWLKGSREQPGTETAKN
jgi:hypothetical protein